MAKLTLGEFKEAQAIYLRREIKQHEGGIKYSEGQVQENKELLERNENACDYCGNEFRNWNNETPSRMDKHIAERHPEDWKELQQERQESLVEAQVIQD